MRACVREGGDDEILNWFFGIEELALGIGRLNRNEWKKIWYHFGVENIFSRGSSFRSGERPDCRLSIFSTAFLPFLLSDKYIS